MGRKKNLTVLKDRLAHVEREIAELSAYQAGDLYQLDDFDDEKEALVWALRKVEAEEIGPTDRVFLPVYSPATGKQVGNVQGEVIKVSGTGYLVRPFEGPYSGSQTGEWYPADKVKLVDE